MSFIKQYAVHENSLLTGPSLFSVSHIVTSIDGLILEDQFIEPAVTFYAHNDTVETDDATPATGNVLSNDVGGNMSVVAVGGLSENVGVAQTLTNGTVVTINADGSYTVDPTGCNTSGGDVVDTLEYSVSNGDAEASATLTVTILSNVAGYQRPDSAAADVIFDSTEYTRSAPTSADAAWE